MTVLLMSHVFLSSYFIFSKCYEGFCNEVIITMSLRTVVLMDNEIRKVVS